MRLPKHIGIIPDGNRRFALKKGLGKEAGYSYGITPGLSVIDLCHKYGIEEATFYGFTVDNTKRPAIQKEAFTNACIDSVNEMKKKDVDLLVVGNTDSPCFPKELLPYTKRTTFGSGGLKVNLLINYSWEWDLSSINLSASQTKHIIPQLHSKDISRIDLIIRWGGRRRLSGFLPVQSVYADFYVIDSMWPDFKEEDFYDALNWYDKQDVTLGG